MSSKSKVVDKDLIYLKKTVIAFIRYKKSMVLNLADIRHLYFLLRLVFFSTNHIGDDKGKSL